MKSKVVLIKLFFHYLIVELRRILFADLVGIIKTKKTVFSLSESDLKGKLLISYFILISVLVTYPIAV